MKVELLEGINEYEISLFEVGELLKHHLKVSKVRPSRGDESRQILRLKKSQILYGKIQASMVYVKKIINIVNTTRLREERSRVQTKLPRKVKCPRHERIVDDTSDGVITGLVLADDVRNGFGAKGFEVLEVFRD